MKKVRKIIILLLIISMVMESFFVSQKAYAGSKDTKITYVILTGEVKTFEKSNGYLSIHVPSEFIFYSKNDDTTLELYMKNKLKLKLSKNVKWKNNSKKTTYSWIKKQIKHDYDNYDEDDPDPDCGLLYVEVKNKKVTSVMVKYK